MPLPNRLPARLPTAQILSRIARVGAVTPELLAALWGGCRLRDISTSDVSRMDRRVLSLMGRGLLHRSIVRTPLMPLRAAERPVFALTTAGEARLASATEDSLDGSILLGVRDLAMPGTGGWACLLDLWDEIMPTWSDRRNVRHRLRRLVREGLLEEMLTRPPRHLALLSITERGLARLRKYERRSRSPSTSPSRPPRLDQAVHHLLVLVAAARLAEMWDRSVHSVRGDEELRSRSRRGQQTAAGSTLPALPDGRVTLRDDEGGHREVAIEVIVSGYTDVQIRHKYDQLPADTLYVVVSSRLVERVTRLGLPRPLLVS